MRMTIPKSQGKQPFYDARKSNWGDIFPHEPKNAPQERFQPPDADAPIKGGVIGKRKKSSPQAASYGQISREIKEQLRRERTRRDKETRRALQREEEAAMTEGIEL